MDLFLDSANLQEIEECLQLGFLKGITTNPSLISKEPRGDFVAHIKKILALNRTNPIPISVEVFARDINAMLVQAKEIYDCFGQDPSIVIKIPIGWGELGVIDRLTKQYGVRVNCTCCFTEAQCILAANAGATYVSIFWGRLRDIHGNPDAVTKRVREIFDHDGIKTKIIVGSIRHTDDIATAGIMGAHIVTAGYRYLREMAEHPQTTKSVKGFLEDFKNWQTNDEPEDRKK